MAVDGTKLCSNGYDVPDGVDGTITFFDSKNECCDAEFDDIQCKITDVCEPPTDKPLTPEPTIEQTPEPTLEPTPDSKPTPEVETLMTSSPTALTGAPTGSPTMSKCPKEILTLDARSFFAQNPHWLTFRFRNY